VSAPADTSEQASTSEHQGDQVRASEHLRASVIEQDGTERPVIASLVPSSVPPPAPREYNPADHEAERIRLFRAAGMEPAAILRKAAGVTDRFLDSHDGDYALRAADQAYKLVGAYAPRAEARGHGRVEVAVVFADFAKPAPVAGDSA
jgi:hypothetical protein